MPLTTGQLLQDRYRIVATLGHGGMGAVYKAEDLRLRIAVALKEMVPQPGLDPETLHQLREQFEHEAMTLARLKHPHLVGVSDFFTEDGHAYLVMEYVEGESLLARIHRDGALSELEVMTWARQLLDALAYCHGKGIIHRDIKPQNVVITPEGDAVLVDFGLVKLWDPSNPQTKTVMRGAGTPEYAPPEQWGTLGYHTDPRTDLYSLGATLYHALVGEAPLTASDRMAFPEQFKTPRELIGQVSSAMDDAIRKAMALARDARWASAQEMADALAGVATPVAAQAMPSREQPGKRQVLWPWLLGAVGVLLLTAGVLVLTRGSDGAPLPTEPVENTPVAIVGDATPEPTETATVQPDLEPAPTELPTAVRAVAVDVATPEASSTPEPLPTPTPQPTDTPSCPPVQGVFAGVWEARRDRLGCAQGAAFSGLIAEEAFEGGRMFWREPIDRAQALVLLNNGTWRIFQHAPFVEGSPEFPCADADTPAQCPPTPKRGFGTMWCNIFEIRSGLGRALDCERGYTGNLQRFDGGSALRTDTGSIYIFYAGGQWESW